MHENSIPAHILVVDDDLAVLEGVMVLLTQAGYRVSSAPTGKQALSLISPALQLVVLDVMLPDIDGHMLCRHMPLVSAQPDRLKQIFLNLLDNAIKYCRPGDAIRVRLEAR